MRRSKATRVNFRKLPFLRHPNKFIYLVRFLEVIQSCQNTRDCYHVSKEEAAMISKKQILFVFSLILATTLACILEGGSNLAPPALPTNDVIATAVEMTLRASGQFQPPPAPLPSPLPEATLPPPTAVFTPTVTLTPTPAIPMVSVSLDTNCRTGPGKIYDYLGALLVGEKAEIVGKNTTSNYLSSNNQQQQRQQQGQ